MASSTLGADSEGSCRIRSWASPVMAAIWAGSMSAASSLRAIGSDARCSPGRIRPLASYLGNSWVMLIFDWLLAELRGVNGSDE